MYEEDILVELSDHLGISNEWILVSKFLNVAVESEC